MKRHKSSKNNSIPQILRNGVTKGSLSTLQEEKTTCTSLYTCRDLLKFSDHLNFIPPEKPCMFHIHNVWVNTMWTLCYNSSISHINTDSEYTRPDTIKSYCQERKCVIKYLALFEAYFIDTSVITVQLVYLDVCDPVKTFLSIK